MAEAKGILLIDAQLRRRKVLLQHLGQAGFETAEAADGLEAVRAMREELPSIVLIDQDVPMGGVKTARLLRLHPRHQGLPFLILHTGKTPEEAADAPGLLFLRRPCSGSDLNNAIETSLREPPGKLTLDEVRQEVADLAHLPVLSAAHRKILGLLGQAEDQIDIPEVVRTIESDQGLTTAVLRVCNSAYYGFRGNSINLAITFLGADKVRAIVQAAIVFDVFRNEGEEPPDDGEEGDDFSLLALWKHAVACGVVMEEGGHRVKGRDHFIAGMLHDVGKVVFALRFPEHFKEMRRLVLRRGYSMVDAEREILGITHADIGYELARKWALPPTIATCIAFHHQPGEALQHRRLSALVHIADLVVRMMDIGHGGDKLIPTLDESARPIARQVMTVLDRKQEVLDQVETMVGEYSLSSGGRAKPSEVAT